MMNSHLTIEIPHKCEFVLDFHRFDLILPIGSCNMRMIQFPTLEVKPKKPELKDNFSIHLNVQFPLFIGNLIARSIISTESIFYVIKFIEKRLLMRLSQFSTQKLPADSYRLEILLYQSGKLMEWFIPLNWLDNFSKKKWDSMWIHTNQLNQSFSSFSNSHFISSFTLSYSRMLLLQRRNVNILEVLITYYYFEYIK